MYVNERVISTVFLSFWVEVTFEPAVSFSLGGENRSWWRPPPVLSLAYTMSSAINHQHDHQHTAGSTQTNLPHPLPPSYCKFIVFGVTSQEVQLVILGIALSITLYNALVLEPSAVVALEKELVRMMHAYTHFDVGTSSAWSA